MVSCSVPGRPANVTREAASDDEAHADPEEGS